MFQILSTNMILKKRSYFHNFIAIMKFKTETGNL